MSIVCKAETVSYVFYFCNFSRFLSLFCPVSYLSHVGRNMFFLTFKRLMPTKRSDILKRTTNLQRSVTGLFGSRYSGMDQVKFVEDSL